MFFEDEYEIITIADCKHLAATHAKDTKLQINCPTSNIASFVTAIRKIINSQNFRKEHFKRRQLFLCETYCLLWQLSGTGDLDHMKTNDQLKTGVVAAMLLDLYASNKIIITENNNTLNSHVASPLLFIQVIDTEPTFTFIDRVIFNKLLQRHELAPQKLISLEECLKLTEEISCVTACLNNLVSRGILGVSNMSVFDTVHRHPTLNVGPAQELERELKAVGLKEKRPDSYMLSILSLSLEEENYYSCIDSILEKYLSKRECKIAKENIKTIVNTQGIILKSPKFTRKKFSIEVPQGTVTRNTNNNQLLSPIIGSPLFSPIGSPKF